MGVLTLLCTVVMAPDDRSLGSSITGDSESASTQTQSIWQMPAEYEWNGLGVSPEAVEDNYHRDAESGLYWLWDMAWNGTGK